MVIDKLTGVPMDWNKIVGYALQVIIVSAILGTFWSLQELRVKNAEFVIRLEAFDRQMALISQAISDRYTATDARRELTPLIKDLADHESRIRVLEKDDHVH